VPAEKEKGKTTQNITCTPSAKHIPGVSPSKTLTPLNGGSPSSNGKLWVSQKKGKKEGWETTKGSQTPWSSSAISIGVCSSNNLLSLNPRMENLPNYNLIIFIFTGVKGSRGGVSTEEGTMGRGRRLSGNTNYTTNFDPNQIFPTSLLREADRNNKWSQRYLRKERGKKFGPKGQSQRKP